MGPRRPRFALRAGLLQVSWWRSRKPERRYRAGISCFPDRARSRRRAKSRGPRDGFHVYAGWTRVRRQDRCPNCRRREWRYGSCRVSFGFAEVEFGFGAVEKALEVGVVLENDQPGCEESAEVDYERR